MKFVKMLTLALGLVTLATASSFAAVAFNTTSTVNMINMDAQTGLIGSVLYTPMQAGTVNAGEIISLNLPNNVPISYLSEITVSVTGTTTSAFAESFGLAQTGVAPNGKTWVQAGTVGFAAYTDTKVGPVSGITVSLSPGSFTGPNNLVVSFGTSVTFGLVDFIKIDGIRVDSTAVAVGGTNLQVSLTNTTGQATTDSPQQTVAVFVPETNILALTSVQGVTGTSGGLTFNANGTPYNSGTGNRNLVTVTIKELFPNAFETKTSGSPYGVVYTLTRIKITVGNLPTGVNITGVTLSGPDGATFQNGQFPPAGTQGAITTNPLEIGISGQSANKIESLVMGLTFGVTAGTVLPLTATPITLAVQLDQAATGNLPYNAVNYYNYEYKYKAPAAPYATGSIPLSFVPITSNLFSQFNSAIHATGGGFAYDTGFAISNLSGSNPSTLSLYPVSSPGTINVILYPMDGTGPYTVNTSALTSNSAKSGLDLTAGTLASKATWKVLLSQLLVPAGLSSTADFTGFVRFNCNFQESAGVAYIGDGLFQSFAVGFPMTSDTPTSFGGLNVNLTTGVVTGTVVPPVF